MNLWFKKKTWTIKKRPRTFYRGFFLKSYWTSTKVNTPLKPMMEGTLNNWILISSQLATTTRVSLLSFVKKGLICRLIFTALQCDHASCCLGFVMTSAHKRCSICSLKSCKSFSLFLVNNWYGESPPKETWKCKSDARSWCLFAFYMSIKRFKRQKLDSPNMNLKVFLDIKVVSWIESKLIIETALPEFSTFLVVMVLRLLIWNF